MPVAARRLVAAIAFATFTAATAAHATNTSHLAGNIIELGRASYTVQAGNIIELAPTPVHAIADGNIIEV